ncbi:AAA family ATPase [Aureibacter tunicatorum]|uniref:MoxR-like ATPase n=1 Tax=Aureibacter tunicatorum TaxID=866807 RepID=A0AAE4BSK7_9BACT|nr:AAA family ATPase [Aureibacter tunicatorum]MDR6239876.1 MoxR-like ATPase [Aureibacter tunicatorum]BDD04351.1 hypothetical protein AUTU_18340 [Aureibacter tunicatorum]
MAKQQDYNYTFYGTKTHATEVIGFVEHILKTNERQEQRAKKRTPICIWGTHGIGKTQIVEQIAKKNNYEWRYIAPAQFEEMGDLIGMPMIEDGKMIFKAPEWVPTEEGKGILLIDDVNRADDRILRGIMQLLQNFELVSWKLPKGWDIILTANPDGGDYSVTPMDDAMLTRMMHITMEFDPKDWALWAEENEIDSRGINFVLTYPEIAIGDRTTPRTLVQFFETIKDFKNLHEHVEMIKLLADATIDENAVTSFISFINQNLEDLITPEDIIEANNFEKRVYEPIKAVVCKEPFRMDIMATICTRLLNHLRVKTEILNMDQIQNIQKFIKLDYMPNDLRMTFLQDLVACENQSVKMVMADPQVSIMLLEKM